MTGYEAVPLALGRFVAQMLAVGMSQQTIMAVLLPLAQEQSGRSSSRKVLLPPAQPLAVSGGEGGGGGAEGRRGGGAEEAELMQACGAGSRSGSGSDHKDLLPACGDISVALDMSDDDEDEGRAVSSSQQNGGTMRLGSTMQPDGTVQQAASAVSRPMPIPASAAAAASAAGTPGSRQGSVGIISGSIAVPGGSGSGSRSFQGGHLRGIWPEGAHDSYSPVGGSYSPIGGSFGSTAAHDKSAAWNGDVGGIHACGGSISGSSYDTAVRYPGSTHPWRYYSGASPGSSYSDAAAAFGSHLLAFGGGLGGAEPATCTHRSGSRSVMGSSPDPLLAYGGLAAGAAAAAVSAFCSVRGPMPAADADNRCPAAFSLGHSDTAQPSAGGSGTSAQPLGIMTSQQPGGTVQLGSTAQAGSTAILASSRDKHPLLKRRPLVSPAATTAGGAADVAGGARKQYGSWELYIAQQPYGHPGVQQTLSHGIIHASDSSDDMLLLVSEDDPAQIYTTTGSRSFGSGVLASGSSAELLLLESEDAALVRCGSRSTGPGIPLSCSSCDLLELLPDFI